MDPTVAALLGAGIGMIGTVLASFITPVLTAQRADRTRNRELRREAYLTGLDAVHRVGNCTTQDAFEKAVEQTYNAMAQIQLVGSPNVVRAAATLMRAVTSLHVELALAASKQVKGSKTEDGGQLFLRHRVSAIEKFEELDGMILEFSLATRSDLDAGDSRRFRLRRRERTSDAVIDRERN